jgi:hypothetical protein
MQKNAKENSIKNSTEKLDKNSSHFGYNLSFFESIKGKLKSFIDDSHPILINATQNFITSFSEFYNILSTPEYDKVQKGDKYSEILHLKVIPFAKTTLFTLGMLLSFASIIFIAVKFAKFLTGKFFPIVKNDIKTEVLKQKISLKGRVKRSPNNINYNEVFIEKEIKPKKKKGCEKKQDNNNLEEFFQIVKEKDDFEKLFAHQTKCNQENFGTVKNNGNLIEFDNLDKISPICLKKDDVKNNQNFESLYNSNTNIRHNPISIIVNDNQNLNNEENNNINIYDVNVVMNNIDNDNKNLNSNYNFFSDPNSKLIKDLSSQPITFPTKNNEANIGGVENENDKSLRMEDKMKNTNLFYQTPLANIRRNTNNAKK